MIKPFLQIPPFPGQRSLRMVVPGGQEGSSADLLDLLRRTRVGGAFWAKPVALQSDCKLVLVPDSAAQCEAMLRTLPGPGVTIVLPRGMRAPRGMAAIQRPVDPWNLAEQACEVWAGRDRELATVAALLGKSVRLFDDHAPLMHQPDLLADLAAELVGQAYTSPFDGSHWSAEQAIAQLADWRKLIESNRDYVAIFGVARWKRVTLNPLLWDGTGPVRYRRKVPAELTAGARVLAWKSRTPTKVLAHLGACRATVAELEDGFIRSVGLGANCVPPLSAIVDRSGIYFDPNGPSDLETMLESDELPDAWVKRAKKLRATLVHAGISKYERGQVTVTRPAEVNRRVLVTGQVEDDRSVLSGGANCSNLDLLARARGLESDAWIVYKPHPDVEAGHRKGLVADGATLQYANAVERNAPIAALIASVDALHVITSLAGFEALLRGKRVTTHGQPFYAGWGLTDDRAAANPRRTRKRSLDELVAATLIGYPRYVDPVTRLPCPPEVLVERIRLGQARVTSPLVILREWQGQLRLLWQRLTGRRA